MSLTKGFYGGEGDIGPEADRIAVVQKALSGGITLLDTADLYGPYDNHILIGIASDDLTVCCLPSSQAYAHGTDAMLAVTWSCLFAFDAAPRSNTMCLVHMFPQSMAPKARAQQLT